MAFSITMDDVLYLYGYYSLSEKEDETSKIIYQVFKKNWYMNKFLPQIKDDLVEALRDYINDDEIVAVTVMPSHSKGVHSESLTELASLVANELGFVNKSNFIQRTVDKVKSTNGGARSVYEHLKTIGLASEPDDRIERYIIIDDITTTGSSLEAAKQLLINNGIKSNRIIKIAVAKTMHDDIL